MTVPRDPDSGFEELLRSAMQGEADAVSPAGDGLARIQQRVAARRGRRSWLRPIAVVGAAAVAGGAGFTAYALTAQPDTNDTIISKQPVVTPTADQTTPPVSPTPTIAAAPGFPASAFYPFTSAAQVHSWEAQEGPSTQSWIVDPVAEAKQFVAHYVLADGVSTVMAKHVGAKTATVTLGRSMTDGSSQRPVKVTTVRLQRYGQAWLVVGAVDPAGFLKVSSPSSGARVSSPVTVTGPGFGADESVLVDVRTIGAPFLTASRGHASFGNGVPTWSATVAFSPPADPRGAVVVVENSQADGGPSRIAVTGVTFDTETTGYPAYFYGIKNARVTKFSARTGAALSYLTAPQPGGGASDPQLVGDKVYYLAGAGTCANSLMSVPAAGGTPALVATPRAGYAITSFALTGDQSKTALFQSACVSSLSPQGLLVSSVRGTTQTHTVAFDGFPPTIVGDPTWEPDSTHVDAVLRTGNAASPVRYDAFAAATSVDTTSPCSSGGADGLPQAMEVDAGGALWIALQTGNAIDVTRCIGSIPQGMFTIAGNRQPADLDVAGSGTAVLVTDAEGHVWRWTQDGSLTQLSPSLPVTQLTW